jgi:hypothetical protein
MILAVRDKITSFIANFSTMTPDVTSSAQWKQARAPW